MQHEKADPPQPTARTGDGTGQTRRRKGAVAGTVIRTDGIRGQVDLCRPNRAAVVILSASAALCWISGCGGAVRPYEINAERFKSHVSFLSSDALEGRGLGSEGIERAADYIAEQFRKCGLEPAGDDGTYFQTFQVKLKPELGDGSYLRISGVELGVHQGEDYIPFPFSAGGSFEGDLVFAGYGITNEDKDYDDYADLDASGRVVLMLRHEPPGWTDDGGYTAHAEFSNKVYNAKEHGAAAILIVNQRPGPEETDHLISWRQIFGGVSDADYGVPALHITRHAADQLLAAGGLESLDALQDRLDRGDEASAAVAGVRLSGNVDVVRQERPTSNVLGALRGAGQTAGEFLVIGAHYDHLGVTVPRMTLARSKDEAEAEPQVHNGADDNASGTAGVIELAWKFSEADPPKRSILFAAFTAEEAGLLGSKHFVEHPTVPLDQVISMLNMDMVGRLPEGENEVQVFGTKAAEGFEAMFDRLAAAHGLVLKGSGSAFGPSDHTSFYAKKIPAVHFFTGLHTDYHLPSDDADKINSEGSAAVLGYVCHVASELIRQDERPKYQRVAQPVGQSRSGLRVRMGIMPSYVDSEDGMGVDGVLEGGPAEKAGMQDGDVIVQIAGAGVRNVYDYMGALRNHKPGEEVEVVVRRNGQEVTLTVKLTSGE